MKFTWYNMKKFSHQVLTILTTTTPRRNALEETSSNKIWQSAKVVEIQILMTITLLSIGHTLMFHVRSATPAIQFSIQK